MVFIRDVLDALEHLAPTHMAYDGDKVGLQVGNASSPVTRAVVAFDPSLAAVRHAADLGAQLLVTHHPLIWSPLTALGPVDHASERAFEAAQRGVAVAVAHTNWDAAPGGLNDRLAIRLGLQQVEPFGQARAWKQHKLIVFCPRGSEQRLLDAVSRAGAGLIGRYERCAFMSEGKGTFVGLEGSKPTIGEPGRVETAEEVRLETLVPEHAVGEVIRALLAAHPYETPAYDLLRLADAPGQPIGRIGSLSSATSLGSFAKRVRQSLGTTVRVWGDPEAQIERAAVVGGAGDEEWKSAQRSGAQVLVTGEVRHHNALEATERGFMLIEAGHFATEAFSCEDLVGELSARVREVDWSLYQPKPGDAGRPWETEW